MIDMKQKRERIVIIILKKMFVFEEKNTIGIESKNPMLVIKNMKMGATTKYKIIAKIQLLIPMT